MLYNSPRSESVINKRQYATLSEFRFRLAQFLRFSEAAALDELYYAECRRTIPSARKPSLAEIERG